MAKNDNLKDFLTDLADAIREKKGTSDPINPQDFTSEIASIETGGGGIAVETDPIFSASPAASITEAKKAEWDAKQDKIADLDTIREGAGLGATALQFVPSEYITETELNNKGYATASALNDKVDKVSGKQLSTEDFTSTLKAKLEGLNNYDDTTLSNALSTLRGDFDKLVSGDTTTAIKTFNEVIAFLDGIQDSQDLSSIIASIQQQIASKQDTISDLATIRINASKGATALQSYTETDPVFSASAAAGIKSSDITNWNSKTSNTGTITGIKMNGASKGTSGVVNLGTVITAHQDISGKADKSSLAKVATSGSYDDLSNKPTIPSEQVNADWNATSGKAQILNKPTIPSAVTESTVSGWGFTKNTGTYSKPSGGIPKSDLASAVQTSLGKADTALQSYTEQYKGTVTSVKVNGSSKSPSSGIVDIGNVVTSIKINGSTKTPSNGVVDLGTISGGASSGSGGEEYVRLSSTESSHELYGNKVYFLVANGSVNHSFNLFNLDVGECCRLAIYVVNIGSVSFPTLTQWSNGVPPTFTEGKLIEISFTCFAYEGSYNYLGACAEFEFRVLGDGGGN